MRVLLVNSNRCTQPVAAMPFGACLVAQAAEAAGHSVRFADLMFAGDPCRALQAELASHPPDVVGVSIRNLDNPDMHDSTLLADDAARIVGAIRANTASPVVLGGPAVGVMPRELLCHTGADMAMVGDGERVFPALLDAMDRGGNLDGLPGLVRPGQTGEFRWADCRGAVSECTVRDFSRWIDVRQYQRHMATAPLQSKRGCPFDCVYCTYNIVEGREYRLQPVAGVVEAVQRLARQGLGDVEFVDNVFNSPYEHALAICEALSAVRAGLDRRSVLPLRLQSLEMNPAFLDDGLLKAMEHAGFVGMGVTAESASDAVLAGLGKGYSAGRVREAAGAVARHKLPCMWMFMCGGPGETVETLRETLEFAKTCIRPTDVAFFQVGVRIYPGTTLETLACEQGVLKPDANLLEPLAYVSPRISLDVLRRELSAAASGRMNFMIGDYVNVPFMRLGQRLAYRLGVRPPLWKYTRLARRMMKLFRLHP